jgi:HlyD family secretion protein
MFSLTSKKTKLVLPVAAIVIATALIYLLIQSRLGANRGTLRVSGNIEITDAEVSFKIPGRVIERLVDEGETVKAGQIVARLDSADLAQEVALRRAEVEAARAALAELLAGSRPEEIAAAEAAAKQAKARLEELQAGSRVQEIAAARAALVRAKAETERAAADAQRYAELYKKADVSAQQNDAVQTAYATALARQHEVEEQFNLVKAGPRQEEIEQARAAWRQAQERYVLAKKGPRRETIEQARAHLEQTKQSLALAETRLGYATLASPLSGLVLAKHVEPGEYVSAGTPVVTVGDLVHVWVRAYVNETDLGRVKVGQPARATTDTYPGKRYEGHVSFISSQAEFTPKNVQTQQERVKLVYRIKVDILNPRLELKPGMPADVEILVAQ